MSESSAPTVSSTPCYPRAIVPILLAFALRSPSDIFAMLKEMEDFGSMRPGDLAYALDTLTRRAHGLDDEPSYERSDPEAHPNPTACAAMLVSNGFGDFARVLTDSPDLWHQMCYDGWFSFERTDPENAIRFDLRERIAGNFHVVQVFQGNRGGEPVEVS